MPITLANAAVNTQDDILMAVIDTLRRESWLMDNFTWDDSVSPAGGGATLTYGYTRLVAPRGATWRPYNNEYSPTEATRERHTVALTPLGGSYELDRVLGRLGQRSTDEVAFQVGQLLTGVRTRFSTEVIRGDQTANPTQDGGTGPTGFDGLDVALAGSTTEVIPDNAEGFIDWSNDPTAGIRDEATAQTAIETLEDMLSLVNGGPSAILTNRRGALRLAAIGRRAGYLSQAEDAFGRPLPAFAGVPIIDLGDINAPAATAEPIIPTETRSVGDTPADQTGLTDIYAVRLSEDHLHGVSTPGELFRQWEPDWDTAGAVKLGEVEMGPVAMVLKRADAAAVLRNVRVQPAA